ncbi:ATP-binding SpoIIE family protein phosphatase (plasmid) [Streptomyces sp. CA-142005]|uniref:ATP-binding SpoIIE family protein phosphatase n=1 Tax=Streptomyces sp. CA-142005 TaxID=3240052 RepID=UPI003D8DD7B0
MIEELKANTAIAYLLEDTMQTLAAAVIGGSPPTIFVMPERIGVDETYSPAEAYQAGDLVLSTDLESEPLILRLSTHVQFPYSVASVPVESSEHRFGALTIIWVPPRTQGMHNAQCQWLLKAGAKLGCALEDLAASGACVRVGSKPLLVPVFQEEPKEDAAGNSSSSWGLPLIPGSSGLTFMYQVHKLAAALNAASSVTDVAEVARSRIMLPFGADAVLLSYETDGRVWVAGHSGYPHKVVRHLHGSKVTAHAPDTHVLLTGSPLFFESRAALTQAYPDATEDGMEASVFLPLLVSGRPVAACALGFTRSRRFSPQEQTVLTMMSNHLGMALERARLGESERALAESLQQKLLPGDHSDVAEVVTTARYLPAAGSVGLGGDWYDVITLPGGRIGLLVGDVEGHNVESSVVMGQLRSAVRAYASEGHDLGTVLARSSRLLTELDTDLMATCCFVGFDTASGVAEVALAGHPPPLLCTAQGKITVPDLTADVPLGIQPEARYHSTLLSIPPGALLVLYTDGLTGSHTFDPVTGARALLDSFSLDSNDAVETIADRIVQTVAGAGDRHDDIALLLARYEGPRLGPHHHISRLSIQRHDLRAVKDARRFVRSSLHHWGLDPLCDDLETVISEVVTNALIHADSNVDVQLREYPHHVRLEVRDTDPAPPVPASIMRIDEKAKSHSEHGRGLVIVEGLASQWGSSPSGGGKTVWVEVST